MFVNLNLSLLNEIALPLVFDLPIDEVRVMFQFMTQVAISVITRSSENVIDANAPVTGINIYKLIQNNVCMCQGLLLPDQH